MRVSLAALFCLAFLVSGAASPAAADTGTATVRVVTSPPLGSGTFRFSGTPSGELTLSGAEGSMSASGLAAGSYNATLVRTDPAAVDGGYQLTSVTCDDDDSTGGVLSRRAKFEIADGESVSCTFLLTKTPEEPRDSTEPGEPGSTPSATPGAGPSGTAPSEEPSAVPGGTVTEGSCVCPKEGPWTINNLPGQMSCTGAANITMPLTPSTQRGTLTIQNGCNTIIGESLSEDDATLVMQRLPGCGYQGTIGGSQGGIPMTIEFNWTVNSETSISGDLYSQASEQGMTCTMTRNYNMNAAN